MSEDPQQQPHPEFLDLEAGSEWRFELEGDENIAIRVHTPEPVYINSEEIPQVSWYPLHRHLKSSIYAPHHSRVEVSTLPISQYTSNSTSQSSLIAVHLALERLRILARRHLANPQRQPPPPAQHDGAETITRGPRVMVLGPPCSGKTTVVKNLVNMALGTGMNWAPGVGGLDPSSPANLIPGSLSLSTPSHPLPTHHLAHPLGSPPTSVPSNTLGADVPTLAWWYGHPEPTNKGVDLWRKLVSGMGQAWRERCEKDPNAVASGLLVDTPSAFTNQMLATRKDNPKARYTLVSEAIAELEIDTIIVIGHEKLTIDLTRLFPSVRILRIPRSSGTVDLDDAYRQVVSSAQVRGYFYGEPPLPKEIDTLSGRTVALEGVLSPYSFQIGWDTLTILRVGEENAAPSTALPLGSSRILSPTRLTRVDPSGPAHITRLLNAVLAIVAITPGDRIKKDQKENDSSDGIKTEEAVKAEDVPMPDGKAEVPDEGARATEDVKQDTEGDETNVEADGQGAGLGDVEDDEDDEVPYVEEIGYREVLGFIVITGIDAQRKKYTVLSPSPGRLPSTVAIAGSIEWVDSA